MTGTTVLEIAAGVIVFAIVMFAVFAFVMSLNTRYKRQSQKGIFNEPYITVEGVKYEFEKPLDWQKYIFDNDKSVMFIVMYASKDRQFYANMRSKGELVKFVYLTTIESGLQVGHIYGRGI